MTTTHHNPTSPSRSPRRLDAVALTILVVMLGVIGFGLYNSIVHGSALLALIPAVIAAVFCLWGLRR